MAPADVKYILLKMKKNSNISQSSFTSLIIPYSIYHLLPHYSWALNNKGLNCVAPLTYRFFPINIVRVSTLQIVELTKCGEKFVCNKQSQYEESKELGFEFWFYQNCLFPAFELVIYQFLCFWGRDGSTQIFNCGGGRLDAPNT